MRDSLLKRVDNENEIQLINISSKFSPQRLSTWNYEIENQEKKDRE